MSSPPLPGRLRRRAEFLRVAAKGARAAMPGVVVQALRRDDADPARVGFTVTRKVGNAVIRNRARRRLREAVRLDRAVPPGHDLVFIGRGETLIRPFTALRDDVRRALERLAPGLSTPGLPQ